MSGLWLAFLLAIWSGVTWAMWRGARGFLGEGTVKRPVAIGFVALAATVWFGVSFWYAGGRKIYYDAEVNRLCRVDGGVKVYETVKLSAAEYDRLAKRNWVLSEAKRAQQADIYLTQTETRYIRLSDPQVTKTVVRFIRRVDEKIVGEYVSYARGGGDIPGPWHGSSYICPDPIKSPSVELQIFIREE